MRDSRMIETIPWTGAGVVMSNQTRSRPVNFGT